MTFLKFLPTASVFLLITTSTFGQVDKIKTLRNRIAEVTRQNTQLTEENTNLHSYLRQLNQTISNVRDSINAELKLNKQLDLESKKWQEATFNVNKTLQASQKDLSVAQDEIRKLKYETEILKDPTILRIYDDSPAKIKENLISRLSENSLGFQFDEEATTGNIKATKQFGSDTEAWWVFDKTIDVLLELNLRVAPHLYDPNRTLVYGSTNLLEKIRYSNKQFTPQDDQDKIRLYQEKAMRLLEMNIRKASVK
jgi:DNA primase